MREEKRRTRIKIRTVTGVLYMSGVDLNSGSCDNSLTAVTNNNVKHAQVPASQMSRFVTFLFHVTVN